MITDERPAYRFDRYETSGSDRENGDCQPAAAHGWPPASLPAPGKPPRYLQETPNSATLRWSPVTLGVRPIAFYSQVR